MMLSRSNPEPPQPSSWTETMRTVAKYSNLGWILATSVALGVFGGQWIDAHLGTEPWLLILGAVFGIAVGLYHFLVVALHN